MSKQCIMVIKLSKRKDDADNVQNVLTKYGCIIKMRLGLHEAEDACSDEGLILLQLVPDSKEIKAFMEELSVIYGVTSKQIEI